MHNYCDVDLRGFMLHILHIHISAHPLTKKLVGGGSLCHPNIDKTTGHYFPLSPAITCLSGSDAMSISSLTQLDLDDLDTESTPSPSFYRERSSSPAYGIVDPVLSRVNPRRGSTRGGDEIVLIVSNLPPTMRLYARFGSNFTRTVSGMILLWLVNVLMSRP